MPYIFITVRSKHALTAVEARIYFDRIAIPCCHSSWPKSSSLRLILLHYRLHAVNLSHAVKLPFDCKMQNSFLHENRGQEGVCMLWCGSLPYCHCHADWHARHPFFIFFMKWRATKYTTAITTRATIIHLIYSP